jgi:hypothetical protein
MRIYIAGPMTGLPDSNYPAFHRAATAWQNAGWDVDNPADHFGGDQTKSYREYVGVDVEGLAKCDAIAMLPGWDAGHSGAIWEHAIAVKLLKIPVYDAEQPVACPQVPGMLREDIGAFLDEVLTPASYGAPLRRGGPFNTLARWNG